MRMSILKSIFIAEAAGSRPVLIDVGEVVEGKGLKGDRYFIGKGSFSRWPGERRQVSLITQEEIDLMGAHGFNLSSGEHRRNLVVEGMNIIDTEGRVMQIGACQFRVISYCKPCGYLEKQIGEGFKNTMNKIGKGGLRLAALNSGLIHVGDDVSFQDKAGPQ